MTSHKKRPNPIRQAQYVLGFVAMLSCFALVTAIHGAFDGTLSPAAGLFTAFFALIRIAVFGCALLPIRRYAFLAGAGLQALSWLTQLFSLALEPSFAGLGSLTIALLLSGYFIYVLMRGAKAAEDADPDRSGSNVFKGSVA